MGVYQRGKKWWLDYYLPSGERVREPVKIKNVDPDRITRKLALQALTIRKAEVVEGKFDIAKTKKQVSFDKLVNAFINDYSKANKKSWQRDVTSCRALLRYFDGKKLTQITPWTVDKYKSKRLKEQSRLKREITKATINRELACLKKMLFYAVGEGWLSSNPLKGYKLYKERPNKVRVVTQAEFQKVYGEASEFLKPLLITALNTGMRKGEILGLKWENVNLAEGYITVEESKSGEARNISINEQLNEALKSVKYKASGEYVFSHDGKPVKTFRTAFNAAVRRAGIERFIFHDLRHTFASILVMRGVDLATVQELLGHANITMTKRYSHPTPEHKKRAVEKLDYNLDTNSVTMATEIRAKTDISS